MAHITYTQVCTLRPVPRTHPEPRNHAFVRASFTSQLASVQLQTRKNYVCMSAGWLHQMISTIIIHRGAVLSWSRARVSTKLVFHTIFGRNSVGFGLETRHATHDSGRTRTGPGNNVIGTTARPSCWRAHTSSPSVHHHFINFELLKAQRSQCTGNLYMCSISCRQQQHYRRRRYECKSRNVHEMRTPRSRAQLPGPAQRLRLLSLSSGLFCKKGCCIRREFTTHTWSNRTRCWLFWQCVNAKGI